jgi:hypothetical protein
MALTKAVTENLAQHVSDGTRGESWVEQMCNLVGREGSASAPVQAVECVRSIIAEHVGPAPSDHGTRVPDCTTAIDAYLLEAWRKAAQDPDDAVCQWLIGGAPAGKHHHHFSNGSAQTVLTVKHLFPC